METHSSGVVSQEIRVEQGEWSVKSRDEIGVDLLGI